MIGDLAGFAAAIVRRGLDYVQVPTSLLSQVDSSVGGKTAINSPQGKNLIGAFHQPVLVIADTALLDTLPSASSAPAMPRSRNTACSATRRSSPGWKRTGSDVFAGGPAREHAIATSCRAKAAIVARDERETGDRTLLNLGHTFGHALEAAAGYSDRLLHGEAIAIGMALAFEFSARRGLLPKAEAERAIGHLAAVGLPTRIGQIPGGGPHARRADGPHCAGQEGKPRQADLHPGARHRRTPLSRRTSIIKMCVLSWLRCSNKPTKQC